MTKFVLIAALGAIASVSAEGPPAVSLGKAGTYAILSKAGISTVPTSAITGNMGVSPIASTAITGFSLVADSTNTFATSTQVTGSVYGPDYASPTPSDLTVTIGDMEIAYTDAAGRHTPNFLNLGSGNLGGKTLAPGLYKFGSSVIIPTDCTIEGTSCPAKRHVDLPDVRRPHHGCEQASHPRSRRQGIQHRLASRRLRGGRSRRPHGRHPSRQDSSPLQDRFKPDWPDPGADGRHSSK
ncbi:unnamed protein product [Polarella glacialis]|uniref:Uncharacterized protein n=1 Tax=Polarella glacialis TaxID=89957 RepID=A0A813I1H9_POLGL|nr:unnamed protein product [Polarella glacialis]